jgi:predicted DNA-binding transcriptional regulator AlpA
MAKQHRLGVIAHAPAPQAGTSVLPDSLTNFDFLPDSANVRQPVVEALYGRSSATVWRRVKDGRIPAPRKVSERVTAWNVGELRRALASLVGEGNATQARVIGRPRTTAIRCGRVWNGLAADRRGVSLPVAFQDPPKSRAELVQSYPNCLVLRLPDATQARELTALVARVGARQGFTQERI